MNRIPSDCPAFKMLRGWCGLEAGSVVVAIGTAVGEKVRFPLSFETDYSRRLTFVGTDSARITFCYSGGEEAWIPPHDRVRPLNDFARQMLEAAENGDL